MGAVGRIVPLVVAVVVAGGAVGIYEVGNRHRSSSQSVPGGSTASDLPVARLALAGLTGSWHMTSATIDGKHLVPQFSRVPATFSPGLLLFEVASHAWDFPISPATSNTFQATYGGVDASSEEIEGPKAQVKLAYQELDALNKIVYSIAPNKAARDGFRLVGNALTLTTSRGTLEFTATTGN